MRLLEQRSMLKPQVGMARSHFHTSLCFLLSTAGCFQVAKLQLEKQHMQQSQKALEQQMAAFQQQLQQLQQEMHVSTALGRCSPVLSSLAGAHAGSASVAHGSMACVPAEVPVAEQQSAGSGNQHSRHSSQSTVSAAAMAGMVLESRSYNVVGNKHVTASVHAIESSSNAADKGSAGRAFGRSHSAIVDTGSQRGSGAARQQPRLRPSASLPARRGSSSSSSSSSSSAALALAQQMANALPVQADSSLQGQMASLMSAIAAGVEERKALAAQGQVLLEMVTGASRASL
jgi:hypothetical protein